MQRTPVRNMLDVGVLKEYRIALPWPDFESEFRKGCGAAALNIAQIDDECRKALSAMLHMLARPRQFGIEPVEMRPILVGRVILLNLQSFAVIDGPTRKFGKPRFNPTHEFRLHPLDESAAAGSTLMLLNTSVIIVDDRRTFEARLAIGG